MKREKINLVVAFVWVVLAPILFLWSVGAFGQCKNGTCSPSQCPPPVQGNIADRWKAPISLQKSHPAICRILIHDTNGSQSFQTGCLVWKHPTADRALVVTAAHGFTSDSTKIVVWDSLEQGRYATLKHIDHVWDIALVMIRKPTVTVFQFATRRPQLNDELRIGGFTRGKLFQWNRGKVRGWAGPVGGHPQELVVVGVTVQSGHSGGPIINLLGRLVGIVSAGDDETLGPCYWHITKAITEVLSESEDEAKVETEDEDSAIPPIESTDSDDPTYNELLLLIQQNAEAIKILVISASKPRPPGAKGDVGPQGERGLQGTPGQLFDIATLTDEQIMVLASRLPPVILQTVTTEGEVIKEASAPLGKPLKLRLVPVQSGGE